MNGWMVKEKLKFVFIKLFLDYILTSFYKTIFPWKTEFYDSI